MSPKVEDHGTDSDDGGAHRTKRRKGPKACDVCRRKKIRCDPDPSGGADRPCVNCTVFKSECTYTYIAKKRRTQQTYIDGLQDRVQRLEKLLASVAPDIDLSKELGDGPDSLHHPSTSERPPIPSTPRPPSPPKPVPRPSSSDIRAAFTDWREPHSTDEEDEEGDLSFLPVAAPPSRDETGVRFHGKSSGFMLLQRVMGMKRTYTGDGRSFPEPGDLILAEEPWEAQVQTTLNPLIHFKFPPRDLQDHLIDVFFRCVNPFTPVLFRPSFEANVRDGLHLRDSPFGAVLLLLCAAASRWSNDPRVLSQTLPDTRENSSWSSAGWDFYFEVQLRYRRNFLHTTSVRDLQMIALASIYLQGTSNPSPSWHMGGLGLRLALDVGAHRKNRPDAGDKLEGEMWKRAFWSLVVLDRIGSACLGRPCAIWEEDIDIDLPIEVDDEYMNEEAGFKQPPDKPSYIAYFNSLVKLTQILIGALRTIYPINKNKSMLHAVGPTWEQDMVASLDSSLNSWLDSIPAHLKWDPNRTVVDTTFYQTAMIHCFHYYVQIVVHRPYITKPPSSSLAFPSLAICTNAARSCAHILGALRHRGSVFVPLLNHAAFASAIVLLFNIWGMNKLGARVDWQSQVKDVHSCIKFIDKTNGRWQHSNKMGTILRELVTVGEFPLPQSASPPFMPGSSSSQKRSRDSDGVADTHANTPNTTSSSIDSYGNGCDLSAPSNVVNVMPYAPGTQHHEIAAHDTFKYSDAQSSYYHTGNTLNHQQLSLPNHQPALTMPQNLYNYGTQPSELRMMDGQGPAHHSACDVLTALDSAYLVDPTSSLGDGIVMDVAQHTLDVWGSAPTGFQWDEWQQFTNIVQSAPVVGAGYSQAPLGDPRTGP